MSIFPFFENTQETVQEMPLYKEVAWDYINNKPIIQDGDFKFVTGLEAVKSWIFRNIQIERYKHEIYTWNNGNELSTLIGKPFNALNKAEAERIVRDSILINPYVIDVKMNDIKFVDGKITMEFEVRTIYGDYKEALNV